jgi:hypothetical protein
MVIIFLSQILSGSTKTCVLFFLAQLRQCLIGLNTLRNFHFRDEYFFRIFVQIQNFYGRYFRF